MIQIIALLIIFLLYIIPLNIVLMKLCNTIVQKIIGGALGSKILELINNYDFINLTVIASILYVIIVILIFLSFYFLFSYLLKRIAYLNDIDIDKWSLYKYTTGQKKINYIANVMISVALAIQFYLRVFDIKIIVFAVLLSIFIFSNISRKSHKKQNYSSKIYTPVQTNIIEQPGRKILEWKYNIDPFSVQDPIQFSVQFDINDDVELVQSETNYVIQRNIIEVGKQINEACEMRGLDIYQKIDVVFTLVSGFKYIIEKNKHNHDIETRELIENNTRPLNKVLEDKEGNGVELGRCAASILKAMELEVIELDVALKDGDRKLAIAVGGADSLSGNYYVKDDKKFFYCLILSEGKYHIGEKLDID